MPYVHWRDAVEALKALVGRRTRLQARIALAAGIRLAPDAPRIVVDSIVQQLISRDVGLRCLPRFRGVRGTETTESQATRIRQLRKRGEPPKVIPTSSDEAEAWIQHLSLKRRLEALETLKLNAGDIVATPSGSLAEVASIGDDGRVHFRGGRGRGSWPDLLTVKARVDSTSPRAQKLRGSARLAATLRNTTAEWSARKASELAEYRTEAWVSDDELVQLETVIAHARDERPIQEFLARHPHVLTSLLGGTERYCIAKPRFGRHFVPDFLLCHADSAGAHWLMVELETPGSSVTLASGADLEKHARDGLAQIHQWRRWLETNLPSARMSRREDGHGLVDIPASPEGLVVVGRRELLRDGNERIRRTVATDQRVKIHTYDWLVDTLRAARRHGGPPGANPHLIHGEPVLEGGALFEGLYQHEPE